MMGSRGFVLPFCLLSLSGVLMLGLYCWREVTLMQDIVEEHLHYQTSFKKADALLWECITTTIKPSFSKLLTAAQTTKKPYTFTYQQARVSVAALPQHPQALRVVVSLSEITLSCGVISVQEHIPGAIDEQRFMVRYFTIGTPR